MLEIFTQKCLNDKVVLENVYLKTLEIKKYNNKYDILNYNTNKLPVKVPRHNVQNLE